MFVDRVWTKVKDLLPEKAGEKVLVRGRLHTSRGTGEKLFYIIFTSELLSGSFPDQDQKRKIGN